MDQYQNEQKTIGVSSCGSLQCPVNGTVKETTHNQIVTK